ncbi:Hypothetical protein LUCI_2932 [Lucifera butyrica]|uniref:Uncharacterized protein n=1 Tax=Lucifera butyrica TaxID=1351585 RepID=A0A498R9N6_9FIRM|nr:molybdate ABC transporter substrate-binding protein [Lucifera butyrica]VBB07667.1 Hypothetical protein LUCI_2932 [Lucifera butyrica]
MKKWLLWMITSLMIVLITAGCGGTKQEPSGQAGQPVDLTVSAAASLKDVLAEIGKNYQAKHPNVKLSFNLGSSGALQQQIEQGAPADLFISAAPKQMDELQKKNLIDRESRRNLVENKLVLIVPSDSKSTLTSYNDLTNDTVKKISIGEPGAVPAGQYAEQVLQKLNIWQKVQDKLVFAKDVRSVLAYVETENVDAGIVYKTDAAISKKVKIVAAAPDGTHKPIIYPAAVVAGSKQKQAAQDFLTYLASAEAATVFEKYGFTMSK